VVGVKFRAAAAALALLAVSSCGHAAATRSANLSAIGAGLAGPPGLKATVYANGLTKASAFAFDSQGRLWVATADATDQGRDGVYLVASPGATPVQVITGTHTPLGLLWYQGSLFVASAGRVDAYTGFTGALFAARRVVLTLPAGVGEVNGMVLGPDGRMRIGISAPCDHCVPTSEWSAAIVSFQPDGSDLRAEVGGVRAPVGLTYYPNTTDLFVTMNQRDDLGANTPGDWLSVVSPGQAWKFPGCYGQGGQACAGVPRPIAVLDKHGAVDGVAIVTGQLGPGVGTSAIVAEWATGRVQRVMLRKSGSTYSGTVAPFLTGLKNPVPVILGPGGTLFVGDWGTGVIYQIST
jgi:glucose/arabinose dehydrogenase